jgi:WD40 repeat protein
LLPRRLRPTTGAAVAIASAAEVLAIGTSGGQIELWRMPAHSTPADTAGRVRLADTPTAAALSPGAALLAASDAAGRIALWRIDDPARPVAVATAEASTAQTLAFTVDGRFVLIGAADGRVWLWPADGTRPPVALRPAGPAIRTVAADPTGQVLAAAGDDSQVHLWRLDSAGPVPLPPLTGPSSKVFDIAFSPDGHTLAAGTAGEHTIYTWDLTDLARPVPAGPPLTGPSSWVHSVAFNPDGTSLTAGSADNTGWQWAWPSRQLLHRLPHAKPVTDLVHQTGDTFVSLSDDGLVRVWTLPGPELAGSTNNIFSVSFDAAGDRLLVGAGDTSLRLWDTHTPSRPALITEAAKATTTALPLVGSGAISPDGHTALAGTTDGELAIWRLHPDANFAGAPTLLPLDGRTIQAIVFSPDGATAALTNDDGHTRLVDLADPDRPRLVNELPASGGIAYGLRFHPHRPMLAVAADDHTGTGHGYLWDTTNPSQPRLITTIDGFTTSAYAAAFSADGALLALGGSDYTVHLVDTSDPDRPVTLPSLLTGPVGEVYELAFHPTEPILAVSSMDATIWLWNLRDPHAPALIATLKAGGGLYTVAFSPNGDTLAAAGREPTVRLWTLDPDRVADRICRTAGATMTRAEWAQFVPDQPYDPPCRQP